MQCPTVAYYLGVTENGEVIAIPGPQFTDDHADELSATASVVETTVADLHKRASQPMCF